MSNDTEFTGPLFLQPSNPDDEQLPEITQPQPQSAPNYDGLFSSRP
ncbi:hypothetical protein ACWDUD_02775 [Rhodococcus sp. NPDC003382]|nr:MULTISPECIES: hypothetical protein [unclassified Rhodococcus (in: high G+C Gram-positive bacteria)]MBH0119683.1 hypothetical protein [Rhodococcus sp. CX]MCK8675248.1 hypothetical protein [Rhodococcus sp. HM1]